MATRSLTMRTNSLMSRGLASRGAMAIFASAGILTATGCNNAGEGALSGGALGALAGMGLGSLTGDMGKGAAAGAIIGAVGGAILGDQNNRSSSDRY